ncbi:hypothetical protein PFICI_09425 [Pestalotiopsis fici W106-1]|uniref:NACHT domain-containing protein n=1 Tax=Pestalotiopsis fici (strain W106-1 / CGMCC3.15140) TaxID=1229662 RepID=W3X2F1_PESFW|nr:uncharacterized protein PFICI_09425 [Pestalotiopsis fici W106-1]ETS79572.1 hypothetical protein PFICI_09425 [Pestalotiopsis fici W106-1]
MEPQAKRRRIEPEHTIPGDTRSFGGPPHEKFQPQSISSGFNGTGVANNGSFNVAGDFYTTAGDAANTANAATTRREELLDSLRFEQIESRQLSIKRAHAKTCSWFLKDPMYKRWGNRAESQKNENFLWIKGKPGAGKSTLMKYLHGQLKKQLRTNETLIAFFFNARGSDLEKSTEGMYRSLLVQLLDGRPELQHVLDRLRPGCQWTIDLLKDVFEQAAEQQNIVCLIDALDECDEGQIRDMVDWFDAIIQADIKVHVCFASRHYPYINIQTRLSVTLEDQDQHENDISSYLDAKLNIGHSKLAEKIRLEMREKASGVFMWVVLVVAMLNKEYGEGNIPNMRKRLRQIPGDLHELFRSILTRDDQDRDGLLLCIQWVLFAKVPLTPKELYFAIISGSDSESLPDYHSNNISESDMQRYILNRSKGLTAPTRLNEKPTIQFIHESVRDFFRKGDGMSQIFPNLANNMFGSSHESLKVCCLRYIEMEKGIGFEKSDREDAMAKFPFLKYANQQILYHADQAASNGLAQRDFLAKFPHTDWVRNHNILKRHQPYTSQVSMLYILAEAGTTSLIDDLPDIQSCFDVEEDRYGLPIIAAMALNNFDCAQEILRVQAKRFSEFCYEQFCERWSSVLAIPNRETNFNSLLDYSFDRKQPKFHEIINYGGEFLSLFFLQTEGFGTDSKDARGLTAYRIAASKGYCHLLVELHHRGVDIELSTGRRALHVAASACNFAAAKRLIDGGADVSVVDVQNRTPLMVIPYDTQDAIDIMRLLIEHGAQVSSADFWGVTALHHVSRSKNGCELARLLLDGGASVAAVDKEGQTPLHKWCWGDWFIRHGEGRAAHQRQDYATPIPEGYLNVGRLLLDRGADVAAVDKYGQTSLHYCNTPETAELLLSHNACISVIDHNGNTPLHWAAGRHEAYLCQLLLQRGADTTALNKEGQTPFDKLSIIHRLTFVSLEDWMKKMIVEDEDWMNIVIDDDDPRYVRDDANTSLVELRYGHQLGS